MKKFYKENAAFKEYVDKYCLKHRISVNEALTHEVVKQVFLQQKERG